MKPCATAPDIPPEEWQFGSVPIVERGICFFWETLREIEKPDDDSPGGLVAAAAARSAAFHRFNRNERNGPLKLLAWLNVEKRWPDKPWVQLDESEREALRSIETVPPIVAAAAWASFLKSRHAEAINQEFDLLYLPFTYEIACASKASKYDLSNFLGTERHEFIINRHQHGKDAIVAAFATWLDSMEPWPKTLHRAGRAEHAAWLWYLSGYRLYRAASSNPQNLLIWKDLFNAERRIKKSSALTIPKGAESFRRCFQRIFPEGILLKNPPVLQNEARIK